MLLPFSFVSMYKAGHLNILVFKKWPYLDGVLWGPVVESFLSPEPGAPEMCLGWTSVASYSGGATILMYTLAGEADPWPTGCKARQMFWTHWYAGQAFGVTSCKAQPHCDRHNAVY